MTFLKMNNTLRTLNVLVMLAIFSSVAVAQVQFKLTLLGDGETYMVSLIPEKTWAHPYNITSTAQVTIKVPTHSFEVEELTSLQLDVEWEDNSRSDAPIEVPGSDYISFGLSTLGTINLDYEAGVEMPLFTFKNALPCSGSIELMDNADDPFMSPNSRNANVGNSIAIFGAHGEAYTGNMENASIIDCQADFSTDFPSTDIVRQELSVYPNPAVEKIFIDMDWINGSTEGEFVVFDASGKEVKRQVAFLEDGLNIIQLQVSNLPSGIYNIELFYNGNRSPLNRFVKSPTN